MAQNNLTLSIQQLDDDGAVLARRQAVISDEDPSAGEFRSGILIDTVEATIGLPFAQCRQLAFRNTHPSALITVKWTPNGGAQATIGIYGPGDGVSTWHQATGATKGFSSLKLTSDTANATYELFIGG